MITFVKKEGVSRTYDGVDGYAPTAAYLGREGHCLTRDQGRKLFEIIGDQRRKCEGVHFAARAVR